MAANVPGYNNFAMLSTDFARHFKDFKEIADKSPLVDDRDQDKLNALFARWQQAVNKDNETALLDAEDHDQLGIVPPIPGKHSLRFGVQDILDTLKDLPDLLNNSSFTRVDEQARTDLFQVFQRFSVSSQEVLGAKGLER